MTNRELYFALRSRVLTESEMARVAEEDYYLIVENNEVFNAKEKRLEFGDALLQQFKMRAIAQGATKP
jgi:hypothetical protein